jgi:hypothetical protein
MVMTSAKRVLVLIAAIVVGWAGSLQTTLGQQVDPRREPATALKEAVRLLESKNYAEFVRKCLAPSELEKGLASYGTVDKIVAEFTGNGRFLLALKAFQTAMKAQPEFNEARTEADYRFDAPIDGEVRLRMRKVDGLWYWAD